MQAIVDKAGTGQAEPGRAEAGGDLPFPGNASVDRTRRAILFVDVVESVRLIDADEAGAVQSIRRALRRVAGEVVPANNGRTIKQLGDGLLVDFPAADDAVRAALGIQTMAPAEGGAAPLRFRVGLDIGEVWRAEEDIYGRRVNVAARLMALAGPGEIVASAEIRDSLASELDAEFEDLGDCYLRHVTHKVRAYRVYPPGTHRRLRPLVEEGHLLPVVAVLPFMARSREESWAALGDSVVEEIVVTLARSPDLSIISRLSTLAFRARKTPLERIGAVLGADYILSGSFATRGGRIAIDAELAEVTTAKVLWADRIDAPLDGMLSSDHGWAGDIGARVRRAILKRESQVAQSRTIPSLEDHTLLIGAIELMHRLSRADFELSHKLLAALIDRDPRQPIPQAWMAKWYVMRTIQGWTEDPDRDAYLARDCTQRALDSDPENSLALVMDGAVHTNLMKRLDIAEQRYRSALEHNPNEALGRLLLGTLHAFRGEGGLAVAETERARLLTPLDPHRHYYDSLAASASIAAEDYGRALHLANESLRLNRSHTSTLRVKIVAQTRLGDGAGAAETARELLALEPGFTVSGWLARAPSADFPVGQAFARTLREAGIPDR
ncbi:MAG: adenylate/guanylate cyclase domain-containing protein [Azospirillaceae bacterium]